MAKITTDQTDYAPGEVATITLTDIDYGMTFNFFIQEWTDDPGDDGFANTYYLAPVTDGGEGDLDGLVNGQIVTSWTVEQSAYNATLDLTATSASGDVTATTTFTDGDQGLWAWRNQGVTANTWNAGTTIQQANSIYAEGEVIPFRWTIATGNPAPQLQEGLTYTIQLDWAYAGGTTSPEKLFFDYLTS